MSDKRAWLRQKGEPNLWFRRFERYRRMGPHRSLLGCLNKERVEKGQKRTDDVPGAWRTAAKGWDWKKRAEAWDDHQAAKVEAEWEAKRKQLREREWKTSQAMLDKAEQMLVYPLAKTSREEKDEAGRVVSVTTIMPTKWGMRDAATMVEIGSKLGRLAANMNTAKTEVDATIKDNREVRQLPDEKLAEIVLNDDDGDGTPAEDSDSDSAEAEDAEGASGA